jgi:CTP:molybdopterin cytidylyltransferase MocA
MKTYQLIVVMAGSSKRFQDAGYKKPKALLLADDKKILRRILGNYPNACSVLVILNNVQQVDVSSELSEMLGTQQVQLAVIPLHDRGPSFSISEAAQFIDKDLKTIVTYCDVGIGAVESEISEALDSSGAVCIAFKGFHPHILRNPTFGYLKCNSTNHVVDIREKKSFSDTPREEFTSAGVYGFRTGEVLLKAVTDQKEQKLEVAGELYLSLGMLTLVKAGIQVEMLEIANFASWGTPEDLEDFNYYCKIQREMISPSSHSIQGTRKILLAGGKGQRVKTNSPLPKQMLELSSEQDLLWKRGAGALKKDEEFVLISSAHLYEHLKKSQISDDKIKVLNESTSSSLQTALLGLEKTEVQKNEPVTFISTDNVVGFSEDLLLDAQTYDLIVWVAQEYPLADINPTHYSWASETDSGRAEKIYIKNRPQGAELTYPLVGNVSFRSRELAESLIAETLKLTNLLDREIHMEDVAVLALEKDMKVKILKCPLFLGVGTPEELDLYRYLIKPGYQDL